MTNKEKRKLLKDETVKFRGKLGHKLFGGKPAKNVAEVKERSGKKNMRVPDEKKAIVEDKIEEAQTAINKLEQEILTTSSDSKLGYQTFLQPFTCNVWTKMSSGVPKDQQIAELETQVASQKQTIELQSLALSKVDNELARLNKIIDKLVGA